MMIPVPHTIVTPDGRFRHPWDTPANTAIIFRCFEVLQKAHAAGRDVEVALLMAELERLTTEASGRLAAMQRAS